MNVLDKRGSDMLTRYKDKLRNVQLTIIPPKIILISVEYSDVIVIYFSCWCNKLFLSSAMCWWRLPAPLISFVVIQYTGPWCCLYVIIL